MATAPRKNLVDREAKQMHKNFVRYIKDETGYDADEKSVHLATLLRMDFQRSDLNQGELAARRKASEDRQAAQAAAPAKKAAAKKTAPAAKKAAGGKAPATPAKRTAAKRPATKKGARRGNLASVSADTEPF
jgi:hypothetical protein